MPLSMMKHLEEDVPPVFMILDTYDKDIKASWHQTQSNLRNCSARYLVFCHESHILLFVWLNHTKTLKNTDSQSALLERMQIQN